MAQGSPRAHIVSALLDVGIDITPHPLSNVIARLRRQRDDAAVLPGTRLAPNSNAHPNDHSKAGTGNSAAQLPADRPVTRIASVPTLAPVPNATPASTGSESKFGAHDPRLLDEVMRSTPDMKAFAKLAPKQHR